jgi:hypothetical protein
MMRIGQEAVIMCLCPYSNSRSNGSECVHVQFLREHREERFPDDGTFEKGEHPRVLLASVGLMLSH